MTEKNTHCEEEIPKDMTDQGSAEYWESHELTEDFLLHAEERVQDRRITFQLSRVKEAMQR